MDKMIKSAIDDIKNSGSSQVTKNTTISELAEMAGI
jgi:hypothetical protein